MSVVGHTMLLGGTPKEDPNLSDLEALVAEKDKAPEKKAANSDPLKVHTYTRPTPSGGSETTHFPQSSHEAATAAGWKRADGVEDVEDVKDVKDVFKR